MGYTRRFSCVFYANAYTTHMDDNDLKKKLLEIARKVGAKRVCLALQMEGLSPRQAEILSEGDHEGKFRRKSVKAVNAVIAKLSRAQAS
jgi:hypothetical protein